jgi:3-deoxy-manno-octulosonate cytidylyltransferase (CMP-KDO synthetase)
MLIFAVPVVFPAGLSSIHRSARIVALIPARYHSTRLPGKALALIDGRPMIACVHQRASEARTVDAVLVATDDAAIAEAVDQAGGTAVMTARDHRSGTDRIAEVAAHLAAEVVVNVQGDEPLIDPAAIDLVVERLIESPDTQMATVRRRIDDADDLHNPAVVKVVVDRHGFARYFSRAPIPYRRPDQPPAVAWKHIGLYAYRRSFVLAIARLPETPLERAEGLEQLRVLEHGFAIATAEITTDTIGVDTPEDLERVRRLVAAGARS